MKKILRLKGVQKLSKEQQKIVKGSSQVIRIRCCGSRKCMIIYNSGTRSCVPGYCSERGGNCIIF